MMKSNAAPTAIVGNRSNDPQLDLLACAELIRKERWWKMARMREE